MEQTETKKGEDTSQKSEGSTVNFNLSKYINTTTIHIAVEVIFATIFFVYFNRKISTVSKRIDSMDSNVLIKRITELEEVVKTQNQKITEIIGYIKSQQDEPLPSKISPKKYQPFTPSQSQTQSQTQTQTSDDAPMNIFSVLTGGMGGGIDGGGLMNMMSDMMAVSSGSFEKMGKIEEIVDEPPQISKEQLDKELKDELSELQNPT